MDGVVFFYGVNVLVSSLISLLHYLLMILIFILKEVKRSPGDGDVLFSDYGCVNELVLKYAVIK